MKKYVQASHDTKIPPRGKQIKYINEGLNPTGSERGLTSQNLKNPLLWLKAATMRIIFPFRLSQAAAVFRSKRKLTTDGRNTECLVFFPTSWSEWARSSLILAPMVDPTQLHLTSSASISAVLPSGWHQPERSPDSRAALKHILDR